MMRRSKKSYHPSAIEQAEQRAWNEAYGFHRDQARRWFIAGAGSIAIAGVAVGSACWLAGQAKVVPYVIAQDHHGMSETVGRLEASLPDLPRIKGHMETWVTAVRAVYADASVQQRNARRAYAWADLGTIAKDQLDEWFLGHQPQIRAKKETVDVDIQSVIPQGSGSVFQVDWQETAWSREPGHATRISTWRMIATVRISIPETDEEMKANWDGVWVVSFHVQQLSGEQS